MKNILFIGETSPSATARHRADALARLGHQVTMLNPRDAITPYCKGLLGALHYRTGYVMLAGVVRRWLHQALAPLGDFDLCWVESGEWLGPSVVQRIKQSARQVILFNHDDPTGGRDGARFNSLKKAIPDYDLCVVVRPFNVDEFKRLGARRVLRVFMSYDEVRHAAGPDEAAPPGFDNDVVFIGRNMTGEGRDLLMLALIDAGIKPAIWGDNWQQSAHWPRLKPYWRGGSISGLDYVHAMRFAKVCIGMLSKGNRDQHTTRSMEIPYAGGLLCAERTAEHLALYDEGAEAVFWGSQAECVQQCQRLLADPVLVQRIKAAGHDRVLRNRVGNEDTCRQALTMLAVAEA